MAVTPQFIRIKASLLEAIEHVAGGSVAERFRWRVRVVERVDQRLAGEVREDLGTL